MTRKVIIDTNTHISSLFSRKGSTLWIALACAYGSHQIFQSPETLQEIEDVLSRPKFEAHLQGGRKERILDSIRASSVIVDPGFTVDVSPDPDDNKFFALAEAVRADLILSGDRNDVLSIPEYKGIKTISPKEFITQMPLRFDHVASPVLRKSGYFIPEPTDPIT